MARRSFRRNRKTKISQRHRRNVSRRRLKRGGRKRRKTNRRQRTQRGGQVYRLSGEKLMTVPVAEEDAYIRSLTKADWQAKHNDYPEGTDLDNERKELRSVINYAKDHSIKLPDYFDTDGDINHPSRNTSLYWQKENEDDEADRR